MKEANFIISGHFTVGKEKDGYMIIFNTENFCTSITLSKKQHKKFLDLEETKTSSGFQVKKVPCPSDRYKAKGLEWVIPFKCISIHAVS